MAKYPGQGVIKIYQAAEAFRANCLLHDGSLLFPDASVWRPEVLDRIHKDFVATPDEGDRTFIVKFKDQVGKAGQDVSRLAAEILSVYFLFPSSVGGVRKRQVVNEVLSWGGDTLPESHLVSTAFSNGIGSGGSGLQHPPPLRDRLSDRTRHRVEEVAKRSAGRGGDRSVALPRGRGQH